MQLQEACILHCVFQEQQHPTLCLEAWAVQGHLCIAQGRQDDQMTISGHSCKWHLQRSDACCLEGPHRLQG